VYVLKPRVHAATVPVPTPSLALLPLSLMPPYATPLLAPLLLSFIIFSFFFLPQGPE